MPQRLAALEAVVKQLQAELAAETAARTAADTALQNAINAIGPGGVTKADLAAETAARAAADTTLQNNIDAEAAARLAADITLQNNIDAMQQTAVPQTLRDLAPFVTVNASPMEGLAGPHIIVTGANVHIRSGMVGQLDPRDTGLSPFGSSYARNGLGNLIVGYNSALGIGAIAANRTGSHNLTIGDGHSATGSGGVFAGVQNSGMQDGTSISGGFRNVAGGVFATVSGGLSNTASIQDAHVP